ncbi:MAG: anti-sigma factor family protein [Candidatus Omnitrophota bacterium]
MKDCQQIKARIPSFLSGELQPSQEQVLREHLLSCGECAQELDRYQQTWRLMAEWEDQDPEPGYVARFWRRRQPDKAWKSWLSPVFFRQKYSAVLPIAATLAVLFFISVVVWKLWFSVVQTEKVLTTLTAAEIEMMENLQLAEDYELLKDLELLEQLDILQEIEGQDAGQ